MPPTPPPRERLLGTASRLFYAEGITGVGVDRIVSDAATTRATMYRHFDGKQDLVVAWLEAEDETIRGYFTAAAAGTDDPSLLMDAVIDGIVADATRYHTRGCPFINAAAEYPDPDSPVRQVVTRHRTWFHDTLAEVAQAAGLSDPDAVASALVLLRDAALVGVHLDGADAVVPAFARTAQQVVAAARSG